MDYYLGQLVLCSFQMVPQGFLPCDGRLLPVRGNEALFSLLGANFGGDGVNNFAIPDLRGRAALGANTTYTLGQKAGQEHEPLTISQFPPHTHSIAATTASVVGVPAGGIFAGSGTANAYGPPPSSPLVMMQSDALANAGGGQRHENRQPYLVMSWIIAITGIYPSRN